MRPVDALREMLADNPYKAFRLAAGAKRLVTFLRQKPKAKLVLSIEWGHTIEMDGVRIL